MADEEVASAFLDLLVSAVQLNQVRIVITLRADFLDRPLLYSEFGELLRESMVGLRSPSPAELSEAITGPARRVGVDVEPSLVERLVSEVHDRPGGLPLLQFALVELFDSRESDLLTVEAHEKVGGVAGSVARRAEAVYESLDVDQRSAVKQLFLRLVAVADDATPTRRRVRLGEVADLEAEPWIEAFARNRMLVFDNDPDTRAPTVEVAHEALLTEWPRLAGWIEAAREDLTLSRRLDESITDWEENDEDDAYLLTAGRLAQHQAWTSNTSLILTDRESDFLEASTSRDLAQRTRRRRRRNLIMAGFGAAALIATLFGVSANRSANDARSEALAASAVAALEVDPELAVLLGIEAMEANPDSTPTRNALNQALQAHRAEFRLVGPTIGSMSPDGKLLAASTQFVAGVWDLDGSTDQPLWEWRVWDNHEIGDTYFSDDNSLVIVVSYVSPEAGGECSWDRFTMFEALTGELVKDTDFDDRNMYWGGPSQTGPFVDIARPFVLGPGGADDCRANPAEGELVAADLLTGDLSVLVVGASPKGRSWVGVPTLSEDVTRLAWTGNNGGGVIDLVTGNELMPLPPGHSSVSPDGSLVLTGNDPLELWGVGSSPRKLREFKASFGTAWFSSSGSIVYGNTYDGRVLGYDTSFGDLVFELKGPGSDASKVQMSDDERKVASSSTDGMTVWGIGESVQPTAGPAQYLPSSGGEHSFFVIGKTYVTSEYLVSWRFVVIDERGLYEDHPSVPGHEVTAVYDINTGEAVKTYPGMLLAVSPDGEQMALQASGELVEAKEIDSTASDGTYLPTGGVHIVNIETGQTQELEGLCLWYDGPPASPERYVPDECASYPEEWADLVNHAVFSPDGDRLAMVGESGRFAVWDLMTGKMEWHLDSPEGLERALLFNDANVAFTTDGRFLVTAIFTGVRGSDQSGTVTVRPVESLDVPVAEFTTLVGGPSNIEFTADGKRVVLNDQGQNLYVVDTSRWEIVRTLKGGHQASLISDIAVDPSGQWVATAGRDGISVVWDIESGEEVQRFDFSATPLGLRNVEWVDEDTLLLGTRSWAAQMTVDPDILIDHARQRLTRSFTEAECATYDIDPCPTLGELR